jgi:hypothetical protein
MQVTISDNLSGISLHLHVRASHSYFVSADLLNAIPPPVPPFIICRNCPQSRALKKPKCLAKRNQSQFESREVVNLKVDITFEDMETKLTLCRTPSKWKTLEWVDMLRNETESGISWAATRTSAENMD